MSRHGRTAALLVFVACVPQPERTNRNNHSDPDASGQPEDGPPPLPRPDAAAPRRDSAARDAGGSADQASRPDLARDSGVASSVSFEKVSLVLANCVFCHTPALKRTDFQENAGLYMRLVNVIAEHAPTGCVPRTLVVPNNPMMSLLYLKVSGKVPAGCGAPMPYKKPMLSAIELQILLDWINAGAPPT
jgi:hypothetical protein